jgi:ABC-type uncharacterized transport system ATPase subunit
MATNTSEDIVMFMKICKEINYEKKASRKAAEEILKRLKLKVQPQTQFLTISVGVIHLYKERQFIHISILAITHHL